LETQVDGVRSKVESRECRFRSTSRRQELDPMVVPRFADFRYRRRSGVGCDTVGALRFLRFGRIRAERFRGSLQWGNSGQTTPLVRALLVVFPGWRAKQGKRNLLALGGNMRHDNSRYLPQHRLSARICDSFLLFAFS